MANVEPIHDSHYNAPVSSTGGSFRRLLRKLSSGGSSLYDTPRPRLYSKDATKESGSEKLSREHHKRLRDRALQRREALLAAQAKAQKHVNRELQKRQIVRSVSSSIRETFHRMNPAEWKNDSKHDRELVDQLEKDFEDAIEKEVCMHLCREASDACLDAVRDHHQHFLEDHPTGTYEQWIQELHPDNIGSFQTGGTKEIDHRFYLSDSDHRQIWNEDLGCGVRAHVPARHLEEMTSSSSEED